MAFWLGERPAGHSVRVLRETGLVTHWTLAHYWSPTHLLAARLWEGHVASEQAPWLASPGK